MPKSNHTLSPPRQQLNASRDNDDQLPKMSETALRKKKNADAQAAFRARRANYIATLEETVTSLESVVLQLQDSCREARNEAAELRQENLRLQQALDSQRHDHREREKFARAAFWQQAKKGPPSSVEDLPPSSSTFASVPAATTSLGSTHLSGSGTYAGPSGLQDPMRYPPHDDSSAAIDAATYHSGPGSTYGDRSPSLPYMNHEGDAVNAHGRPLDQRLPKIGGHYSMYIPNAARDTGWPSGVPQSNPTAPEPGHPESSPASHSPGFMESPSITNAEMPYGPRFTPMDEQKTTLPSIDAPYMFGHNRSISPANSNHTGSSTSVSSNFQFVFPENRTDDYRRHNTHGVEVTLHGGTADVSSYMGARRPNAGPDRPMLGSMPPFSPGEDRSREERAGSESAASQSRRSRRHAPHSTASRPSSRSPSPSGQPPISSTLAVIKAQAFGALRRTRTRPKKATDGAAKAAMELLEARGIGLGIGMGSGSGQKRQRVHTDDEAMQP